MSESITIPARECPICHEVHPLAGDVWDAIDAGAKVIKPEGAVIVHGRGLTFGGATFIGEIAP